MTRIAVIPAYEPDERLPELAREAAELGFTVMTVDDGSGEKYADVFREAESCSRVISYPENRGKGFALKAALSRILSGFGGEYTVVTLDSDGQHKLSDAVRLCEMAEIRPDALILGSRRQSEASPVRSRFGNAVTRLVFRASTGVRVYDTQTGLRAFSSRLVPALAEIPGERYEYEMNTLMECALGGVPIIETEIETIYIDKNAGSHFDTVKDSWRIYKGIMGYAFSRRDRKKGGT